MGKVEKVCKSAISVLMIFILSLVSSQMIMNYLKVGNMFSLQIYSNSRYDMHMSEGHSDGFGVSIGGIPEYLTVDLIGNVDVNNSGSLDVVRY